MQASHQISFGKHLSLDSSLAFHLGSSQVSDPQKELIYALVEQRRQSTRGNINLAPNFYFFNDKLKIQTLANASQTQIKMDDKNLARRAAQNLGLGLSYTQPGWGQLLWQAKRLNVQDEPEEALDNPSLLTMRGDSKEYNLNSSNIRLSIFVWELLQGALGADARVSKGKNKKRELEIYAALGNSERVPALTEAYGDGSNIVANPELKAEQAQTQSYGIETRFVLQTLRLELSGAYFQTESQDLILFVPNSPFTVRAVNAAETRITGYEMGLSVQWKHYLLNKVRFTQLDAKDSDPESPFKDNFLPLRPRYAVECYIESGTEKWRPFCEPALAGGPLS